MFLNTEMGNYVDENVCIVDYMPLQGIGIVIRIILIIVFRNLFLFLSLFLVYVSCVLNFSSFVLVIEYLYQMFFFFTCALTNDIFYKWKDVVSSFMQVDSISRKLIVHTFNLNYSLTII